MDEQIAQAIAGDRGAMNAVLTEASAPAWRFARRFCRTEDEAADVVQDTLLLVFRSLHTFAGRSSFTSWVYALTRSAVSRRHRGLKNQPLLGQDAIPEREDAAPRADELVGTAQRARTLDDALHALGPDQREVLVLRDLEGLTAPETAEALGIGVDAVKSRLHRARAALRDLLTGGCPPGGSACPDVVAMLSRKLEGDLAASDCAAMEQHLLNCPRCAMVCDTLRSALGACQKAGGQTVPLPVQARVRTAARSWMGAIDR